MSLWAPIQRFYGGRDCDIPPAGELGLLAPLPSACEEELGL
jgi:hypothetical protein